MTLDHLLDGQTRVGRDAFQIQTAILRWNLNHPRRGLFDRQ
jgi:hypothetical protein